MIPHTEIRWIENEVTKERRLYYRCLEIAARPGNFHRVWSPWLEVKTQTLDEAAMEDLIASGGIAGVP